MEGARGLRLSVAGRQTDAEDFQIARPRLVAALEDALWDRSGTQAGMMRIRINWSRALAFGSLKPSQASSGSHS